MNMTIPVAVVLGSTREGRFGDKVAAWVMAELLQEPAFVADLIDPLDFDLPARHATQRHEGVDALEQRLRQADAFLVVVPEYNHGYPAALKFLIDSVREPWQAKPVGFVSYGGISGGLRAVEQLRQVFAELHGVTVRTSVSFADAWNRFDPEGHVRDPGSARRSLEAMLKQLQWWALALREARGRLPYGEVVR